MYLHRIHTTVSDVQASVFCPLERAKFYLLRTWKWAHTDISVFMISHTHILTQSLSLFFCIVRCRELIQRVKELRTKQRTHQKKKKGKKSPAARRSKGSVWRYMYILKHNIFNYPLKLALFCTKKFRARFSAVHTLIVRCCCDLIVHIFFYFVVAVVV